MKCDNCIHKEVCKYKIPESLPRELKKIAEEDCKHYKEREKE